MYQTETDSWLFFLLTHGNLKSPCRLFDSVHGHYFFLDLLAHYSSPEMVRGLEALVPGSSPGGPTTSHKIHGLMALGL
jgi:hypothetical protein